MMKMKKNWEKLISIDLAANEKNETGIAYVNKRNVKEIITKTVFSDDEIIKEALKFHFAFIDAPLSLPKGRKHIDKIENKGKKQHFRNCDLVLKTIGIRFFPITIGGMRALTKRGIKIKNILEKKGIKCYEIFPGGSYDMFNIPRKNIEKQISFYRSLGFSVKPKNQHESDAIAGLITAFLFLEKKAKLINGKNTEKEKGKNKTHDGSILLPLIT